MIRYLKAIGLVVALTVATNVFGFVREMLMARTFGTSAEVDAFISAFTIVSACFLIFTAGTVQSAFMPLYQERESTLSPKGRWLFWHSARHLCVLLAIAVVILEIGAEFWVNLIVPGFSVDQRHATAMLVQIMAPMIVLLGVSSLFQSVAHAYQRFLGPALVPLLNNVVLIAFLTLIGARGGVTGLAIAYLCGACLWWLVLVPGVWNRIVGEKAEDRPAWRTLLVNLGPLLIMLAADQVSALIQKGLVSGMEAGTIAALNYAAKLEGLPVGIFSAAIATVYFPALVDAISRGEKTVTSERFMTGVSGILLCSIPAMTFLCLQAEPVVRVLFERGAFDAKASELTSGALIAYSFGLLPQGLIVYFNRVYFAAQNTTLPMKVGLLSAGIHIIFCTVAVHYIGYLGIPWGTTLYAGVYATLLFIPLRRIIQIKVTDMVFLVWRPLVGSIALAGVLVWGHFEGNLPELLTAVGVSGAIYLGSLVILQEPIIFGHRLVPS